MVNNLNYEATCHMLKETMNGDFTKGWELDDHLKFIIRMTDTFGLAIYNAGDKHIELVYVISVILKVYLNLIINIYNVTIDDICEKLKPHFHIDCNCRECLAKNARNN